MSPRQEQRRLRFSRYKQQQRHDASTASFFADLRQGRSDQGSSPCSTPPRSPSPTPPSSRYTGRLLLLLGAGSSNRRGDRPASRSTWFCPSTDRAPHTRRRI